MSPRPRRYLFLALLCTCLFALLAILLEAGVIGRLDSRLVDACYRFAVEHPTIQEYFIFVTNLGAGRPLWVVGTVAVLLLAFRREWFRALVWTVGLLAARPVSPWFKAQFERVRPPFVEWADFSFPSGHAFGSAVTYGMFALVVLRVLHHYRWRWLLAGAIFIWIALIALSRPMLGFHYPSDVVAGVSLGLAWAFYWSAVADWWDLRRLRGSAERVEQTQDPG